MIQPAGIRMWMCTHNAAVYAVRYGSTRAQEWWLTMKNHLCTAWMLAAWFLSFHVFCAYTTTCLWRVPTDVALIPDCSLWLEFKRNFVLCLAQSESGDEKLLISTQTNQFLVILFLCNMVSILAGHLVTWIHKNLELIGYQNLNSFLCETQQSFTLFQVLSVFHNTSRVYKTPEYIFRSTVLVKNFSQFLTLDTFLKLNIHSFKTES